MIRCNGGYVGCYRHGFVFKCFNGLIPKDMVVDHINGTPLDNRLCNLHVVMQRETAKIGGQEETRSKSRPLIRKQAKFDASTVCVLLGNI